jgi:hypothetical protein
MSVLLIIGIATVAALCIGCVAMVGEEVALYELQDSLPWESE